MTALVSVGVAGALGPATIASIAAAAEAAGFHALWVNDTPDGDSLAALAAAAETTSSLTLATGVVPVDRRPAAEIVRAAGGLPQDRLVLGVGSGTTTAGALRMVADAVTELRAGTRAQVLLGALGPRMRELAASVADGPLLSWLTPEVAAEQGAAAHASASARVALYVRTALEEAAVPALRMETERYASYPNYAANFARLGIDPHATVLAPDSAPGALAAYRAAVDEVVLRAIVTPTASAGTGASAVAPYLRFIAHAASLLT